MEDLKKLMQMMQELSAQIDCTQKDETAFVTFTENEVMKMPKTFRRVFRIQGKTAHVRKRQEGRYRCSYEIRYTRDGYNISASGVTLALAKERFIEKLNNTPEPTKESSPIPCDFNAFAEYWFENFHKRKVKEITYTSNYGLYNRHIRDKTARLKLTAISPVFLQSLLDDYCDKPKTQDDIYSLFNQILNSAVNHGVLKINPLGMIFHKSHERINGIALTIAEEKKLLTHFANTPVQAQFALLLYTGVRPSEYASITVTKDFIVCKNGKRKKGKEENKKIPISPMLRPYIAGFSRLYRADTLKDHLKSVLPNHKLYDLRTTFQTRCTECGVADSAIGYYMGNSIGKLKDAYTDLSDSFLLSEGKKLSYNNGITPKIPQKNII